MKTYQKIMTPTKTVLMIIIQIKIASMKTVQINKSKEAIIKMTPFKNDPIKIAKMITTLMKKTLTCSLNWTKLQFKITKKLPY